MKGIVSYKACEGIGNRLRIHFVAHAFALATGRTLVPCWDLVKACRAGFSDVFVLPGSFDISRRPLLRKIHESLLRWKGVRLNGKILEAGQDVDDLRWITSPIVQFQEGMVPNALNDGGRVLGRYRRAVVDQLRPVSSVARVVDGVCRELGPSCIGFHIRRGDFHISFPECLQTIENIVALARAIRREFPDVAVFVATDDLEYCRPLLREARCVVAPRGPRRASRSALDVFEYEERSNRDTVEGVREGLTDLLVLSRTRVVIGTPKSSFTEMAGFLTGVPLTYPNAPGALETVRSALSASRGPVGW